MARAEAELMVPMAIGVGEGGDVQAAMARAVIGGLMSATVITLVIIPVMYSIFEKRMTGGSHWN